MCLFMGKKSCYSMGCEVNYVRNAKIACAVKIVASLFILIISLFCSDLALAALGPAKTKTLGQVASQIIDSFSDVAKFITASFYLLGTGFIGSAIFKFRAHKDNPTQIPVGTPIALTFIGAAFLYTPSLFGTAGMTMFGKDATAAGVGGLSTFGN
jgi:hypothetical protein